MKYLILLLVFNWNNVFAEYDEPYIRDDTKKILVMSQEIRKELLEIRKTINNMKQKIDRADKNDKMDRFVKAAKDYTDCMGATLGNQELCGKMPRPEK